MMSQPLLDEELSIKEVAAELDKSYITVLRYVKSGKLLGVRRGGQWVVRRSELERFKREGNWCEEAKKEVEQDESHSMQDTKV